jgi:hypothetical protein
MIRIGIDFDNTIVCYDTVFHTIALEERLIPETLQPGKAQVRDYLRGIGREEHWTELQGLVYGARMDNADPFPGVIDFFLFCRKNNLPVSIVSHKTRYPYRGPKYDLHHAAYQWLELYGFFDPGKISFSKKRVFFELTKYEKIHRIARLKCTHFIDDLPEFLSEPDFPSQVQRILFDPNGLHPKLRFLENAVSWEKIKNYFNRQMILKLH